MAINVRKVLSRFGRQVSTGTQRFAKEAVKDFSTAGKFVRDKALPAIERVAGQVGKGLAVATPFIAAVAPELAPIAFGASRLASALVQGASTGRRAIKSAEDTVGALRRGDTQSAIQSGQALRRDLRV